MAKCKPKTNNPNVVPKWKRDMERKERARQSSNKKELSKQLPELASLAAEVKRLRSELARLPVFTFLDTSERVAGMMERSGKLTDFVNGRELLIKSKRMGKERYVVFTVRADGF